MSIPIECYIAHLFLLLPLPPRGCVEVVYQILNSVISVKIPPVNQLPFYDSNMSHLFQSLSISVVLTVFMNLLLEDNVVFLSSSTDKLCSCSYSLLSLLYPFKWCLVYVPVLPSQLVDYLYSPVKYVYGIHSKMKDDVFIRCSSDTCIIDLDQGKIENNDEMVNIHSKKNTKTSNVQLPEHYSKKLIKNLHDLLYTKENTLKKFDLVIVSEIRNIFFQFFVSILQNYKQFLNYENFDVTNIATYFDQEGFLLKNKTDKDFFRRFFTTQMFANFCDRNIRTVNMEQHSENLLFNEHIISKKNRSGLTIHKKPTLFISDTSQNFKSKYVVPPAETCFTKQGSFFYYTFPELNYEVLAEYGLPTKFHQKFTENSIHILENRLLERQRTAKQTRENSLYVMWLELWASCLWAQDEGEQSERITEVIFVLDKMNKSIEKPTIKIYTFLIESCFNVNPSIALSIFSYMNTMQVLVDASTVIILQKVISKLFSSSNKVNIKPNRTSIEISRDDLPVHNAEKFRKRVFNKKNNSKTVPSHAINMTLIQKCYNCSKEMFVVDPSPKNICCKVVMDSRIKVKIGLDVGQKSFNIEEVKLLAIQELDLLSSEFLQKDDNKNTLSLESLRENSLLFWNLIWHFNNAQLSYKFFVPYEENWAGNAFKISLHDDSNTVVDLTPQQQNEKTIQTDLNTNFLLSILY